MVVGFGEKVFIWIQIKIREMDSNKYTIAGFIKIGSEMVKIWMLDFDIFVGPILWPNKCTFIWYIIHTIKIMLVDTGGSWKWHLFIKNRTRTLVTLVLLWFDFLWISLYAMPNRVEYRAMKVIITQFPLFCRQFCLGLA